MGRQPSQQPKLTPVYCRKCGKYLCDAMEDAEVCCNGRKCDAWTIVKDNKQNE